MFSPNRDALRVLVAGIDVGDVALHHVLHKLLESDLRDPAELLLRLRAVALDARAVFSHTRKLRAEGRGERSSTLILHAVVIPSSTSHLHVTETEHPRFPPDDARIRSQNAEHRGVFSDLYESELHPAKDCSA